MVQTFHFYLFSCPLAEYFETSVVNITVIQATSYLAGIIGGILFRIIADRKGRRLGLALTVATYSIFTLLSGFASSFSELLAMRIIAGIGIGGESGIAFAYLNEVYHAKNNRRGLFNGALQSMFVFGASSLPGYMVLHRNIMVWRPGAGPSAILV